MGDTLPTLVLWLIPTVPWSLWTSLLSRQLELITLPSLDPLSIRERERELVSHETYLLCGCVNSTQIVIVKQVCNIKFYTYVFIYCRVCNVIEDTLRIVI